MIKIENLSKIYSIGEKKIPALRGITLDIGDGEFLSVVGRSGCGKTTFLRLLASLEEPTGGEIYFNGRLCTKKNPAPAGMVFQEPRLLPWLTVCENIIFAYPPRERCQELQVRARKMVKSVGLAGYEDARPDQLSGGMAQRVALGRALLKDPPVVLLDEPFGALDYFTRLTMQEELLRLYVNGGKSFIMVTHDVGEALRLGTRVIVLGGGKIKSDIQVSLPYPRQRNSADFQSLMDKVLEAVGKSD